MHGVLVRIGGWGSEFGLLQKDKLAILVVYLHRTSVVQFWRADYFASHQEQQWIKNLVLHCSFLSEVNERELAVSSIDRGMRIDLGLAGGLWPSPEDRHSIPCS